MQQGSMLQESLGGNAKTSLVIAVANAEDHIDESLQSLQFGSRAMRILTRAVVNERMDVKVDDHLCTEACTLTVVNVNP